MRARGRKVQKMTRDGLVGKDLAEHSSVRVSRRSGEVEFSRSRAPVSGRRRISSRQRCTR